MTEKQRRVASLLIKMIEQLIETERLRTAQLNRLGDTLNILLRTIQEEGGEKNEA